MLLLGRVSLLWVGGGRVLSGLVGWGRWGRSARRASRLVVSSVKFVHPFTTHRSGHCERVVFGVVCVARWSKWVE